MQQPYKNILVMGAAYGGQAASKILAESIAKLKGNWRIVVVERNTHFNHVYAFPRFSVLPGHEYKAFVRYLDYCKKPGAFLQLNAQILSLASHTATLDRAFPEHGIPTPQLKFEYAIYALGGSLPSPVNVWGPRLDAKLRADPATADIVGSKPSGCSWLQTAQSVIAAAPTILVVGGGALGIQLATDTAAVHPGKKVTLLHSRGRLMPRFSQEMHDEIMRQMAHHNINVILSERLDMQSVAEKKTNKAGQRVVRTVLGRELAADLLLLCTGQKPNTEVLATLDPSLLAENGRARITRTLQLDAPAHEHIFAVGDCADAFNALCAGHNAYYQAQLAARNILRLIEREEDPDTEHEALELYEPLPPAIKVSLGLDRGVMQTGNEPLVISDHGHDDLQCKLMWEFHGHTIKSDDDMRE